MTATITTALFDADGTLVDSNYLHVTSWWQAFAQAGHEMPMPAIHRAIGMGSDQLLDSLLPATRNRDADAGIRAAHGALYATYWTRLRPLAQAPESCWMREQWRFSLTPRTCLNQLQDGWLMCSQESQAASEASGPLPGLRRYTATSVRLDASFTGSAAS